MLHIYRQISALRRVRPIVITQKRENAECFPFEPVYSIPKPATHFFRRFWFRQLLQQPWQISRLELDALRSILDRSGAQLLHIYFGHIAVHLMPLIGTWPHPSVVSFHGADVLVELKAVCECGRKATMNLRVDAEGHAVAAGAQTEIGGNDRYVALCRKHFFERLRESEARQLSLDIPRS